jgi:phospholipase C
MKLKVSAVALAGILAGVGVSTAQEGLAKIKTIVVIYAENRSFDHLYGFFPGANGIANATVEQKTQLDHDGTPLPYLTIFRPNGRLIRSFRVCPMHRSRSRRRPSACKPTWLL